jgi:flavodoxin
VYYDKIIKQANETIKDLLKVTPSQKLDLLLSMAEKDIKIIESAFNSNNLNLDDYAFIQEIVDTWSSINNLLGIESIEDVSDEKIKFRDIEGNVVEKESARKRLSNIKKTYDLFSEKSRVVALNLIEQSQKSET